MTDFDSALEDWIDDNSPHLAILSRAQLRETEEYRAFVEAWREGEKKESRKAGAVAAAQTRAKNAAKGITQKGLKGSTKQKRWASEIRNDFMTKHGASHPVALKIARDCETPASFWIKKRNQLGRIGSEIERLSAASAAASDAYDAKLASLGAAPGQRVILDDEASQLADDLRSRNREFWDFVS